MHIVCAIKCNVTVALNQYFLASRDDTITIKTLTGQLQSCCRVDTHRIQGLVLTATASRIRIDLTGDELLYGLLAIADDACSLSLGCRREFASDDEQPVFITAYKFFYQHTRTFVDRHVVGSLNFFACFEIDENASSMITVHGFDDNR